MSQNRHSLKLEQVRQLLQRKYPPLLHVIKALQEVSFNPASVKKQY